MYAGAEVRPCSEACERNKDAIAGALAEIFQAPGEVLEIGSGTGQHAVHFAAKLPHLTWQCSDLPERHAGISMWISDAALDNVRLPLALDVAQADWPERGFAYAFSANTAHIMSWSGVCAMFGGLGRILLPGGRFALYGPFNIAGKFTSESNRAFDRALRGEDPSMGIRNFEDVRELASSAGLSFADDLAMPANNRLLVFSKS